MKTPTRKRGRPARSDSPERLNVRLSGKLAARLRRWKAAGLNHNEAIEQALWFYENNKRIEALAHADGVLTMLEGLHHSGQYCTPIGCSGPSLHKLPDDLRQRLTGPDAELDTLRLARDVIFYLGLRGEHARSEQGRVLDAIDAELAKPYTTEASELAGRVVPTRRVMAVRERLRARVSQLIDLGNRAGRAGIAGA